MLIALGASTWALAGPAQAQSANAPFTWSPVRPLPSETLVVKVPPEVYGPNDVCEFRTWNGTGPGFQGCHITLGATLPAQAGVYPVVLTIKNIVTGTVRSDQRNITVYAVPTPSEVAVKNRPDVRLEQPAADPAFRVAPFLQDGDPALRVHISNWRQVSEGQGGLSAQDSENLESILDQTIRSNRIVAFSFALALFSLAGLLVLALPKVRA